MAPVTSKYERPDVRRYRSSEVTRCVLLVPYIDVDRIAQREIESGCWNTMGDERDRHGYPTT